MVGTTGIQRASALSNMSNALLCAGILLCSLMLVQPEAVAAEAAGGSDTLQRLKSASAKDAPKADPATLSPVREAALRETARSLGIQAGIGDRSREIISSVILPASSQLDAKFQFSRLIMGVGILPAVISKAENAVAIDGNVMRVAIGVYRIDEPARPVAVPPTWRDFLMVGLDPGLRPVAPTSAQLLPQDDAERRYWHAQLDEAYAFGVKSANDIFDVNLARLERTYKGMREFYDLHQRGMVTAPTVIASSSIIDRDDPNTVAVGATVFKIVAGTDFVEKPETWKPLGR